MSTSTTSAPRRAPLGDRVEGDRAGVLALARRDDDVDAGALGPAVELLDRGGAERVGGAEHDVQPEVVLQVPGELAERGGLAGAVDADHEDDRGVVAQVDRVLARAGDARQQLGQAAGQRLAALDVAGLGLLLELRDDLRGRLGADVGHDQRLLQALPRLLVDVALEQRRLDLGLERDARLGHVLAQAAEEAAALALLLGLGRGGLRRARAVRGDEELVPVAGHDDARR